MQLEWWEEEYNFCLLSSCFSSLFLFLLLLYSWNFCCNFFFSSIRLLLLPLLLLLLVLWAFSKIKNCTSLTSLLQRFIYSQVYFYLISFVSLMHQSSLGKLNCIFLLSFSLRKYIAAHKCQFVSASLLTIVRVDASLSLSLSVPPYFLPHSDTREGRGEKK